MKNIILLTILVSALAFNAWWHAEPVPTLEDAVNRGEVITNAQSEATRLYQEWEIPAEEEWEIPAEEDTVTLPPAEMRVDSSWKCVEISHCEYRCRRLVGKELGPSGGLEIIQEETTVGCGDDAKMDETTKPDRFPVCPIHEWTCLKVGNPCTLICQRPTDDPRYGESKIAGCEADTWPDFSPACEI